MLHSDQGRGVESHLWAEICVKKHIYISASSYKPLLADGIVEWFNRTLIQYLQLISKEMIGTREARYITHACNANEHAQVVSETTVVILLLKGTLTQWPSTEEVAGSNKLKKRGRPRKVQSVTKSKHGTPCKTATKAKEPWC